MAKLPRYVSSVTRLGRVTRTADYKLLRNNGQSVYTRSCIIQAIASLQPNDEAMKGGIIKGNIVKGGMKRASGSSEVQIAFATSSQFSTEPSVPFMMQAVPESGMLHVEKPSDAASQNNPDPIPLAAGSSAKRLPRYGITVTRKLGNAVKRNLIKRRIRAILQEILPRYGRPETDYVLIARSQATAIDFQQLKKDMVYGLQKIARSLP